MSYRVQGMMLVRTVKGKVRANRLRMGYLPHGPVTTFWGKNADWQAIAPHILKTKYFEMGEGSRTEVFPTGKYHSGKPYRNRVYTRVMTYQLSKFADGGCPLYYATADNQCLCATCATEQATHRDLDWPRIVAVEVYYEGPAMTCDNCSADIESAYGDPDTESDAA